MKYRNRRISIYQAIIMVLMSAASAYSLVGSLGIWVLLVFTGLAGIGMLMIFYPRFGFLPFSLLSFVAFGSELFRHNAVDLITLQYKGIAPGGGSIFEVESPELSLIQGVIIGLITISGSLVLYYFATIQKEYNATMSGEAGNAEVEMVTKRTLSLTLLIPALCTLTAAAGIVVLKVVQPVVGGWFIDNANIVMPLGIVTAVILAAFMYRFGTSRKRE